MVKLIDYFFLKLFRFALYLKKDSDSAKWGAFLYLSAYVAATGISFVCLLGLLIDNDFSNLFKLQPLYFWMTAWVLSPILLSLRYYRYTSVAIIEASYNAMGKGKHRIINLIIYAAMIVIPVLTFILYNLYVKGRI